MCVRAAIPALHRGSTSTGDEQTVQKGETVLTYHLNLFYILFYVCASLYKYVLPIEATNILDRNSSAFSIYFINGFSILSSSYGPHLSNYLLESVFQNLSNIS